MGFLNAALLVLLAILVCLAVVTRVGAWMIESRFPPSGAFATVGETRMHYLHEPAGSDADIPPIVFLHGASGNLADQVFAFRDRLAGRAELLFVDRPGHGWSDPGPDRNRHPDGQAATLRALMDYLGIEKAIIVGHSFGGAITVNFALDHPDRTLGTLFVSPVSHPWPGGIDWHYKVTALPGLGHLFAHTIALPAGLLRIRSAIECVFAPNRPTNDYLANSGVALVLRPRSFRSNAIDVANLYDHVAQTAPRYSKIETPAIVITGDKDTIVLPRIHSDGLARDLQNVELVRVKNLGHKPDYVATDLIVAAIEKLAGKPRDLDAQARALEPVIADDRFGPVERCLE
ncbi:alpha/beta fold hydrolase [Oricola sp.]|uniref:alpha/beta fold hydrolase n=1 Tax=Oricola sp. TaxID=1979950 RepID=UPI003BABDCD8